MNFSDTRPRRLLYACGVCTALLCAAPVLADNDDTRLAEIVVTANKRVENVQDVASSVTVESGAQLLERGQSGLADYAAYMPGLVIATQGTPGQANVSLRGISTGTSTSAIGTYLDDVPMGGSSGWLNAATTYSTCCRTISIGSKSCAARRVRSMARGPWAASSSMCSRVQVQPTSKPMSVPR
jgi:hypothetical protein